MKIFPNRRASASAKADADLVGRLFAVPVFRRVFDNGLILVHRPDFSSEVVSAQIWVKTGSIHEGGLTGSGLSHYLEHLLFKGTARREGKSIAREVHAMGGSINAYTTFDRTVYHIDVPSGAFGEAVDLLSDIVSHSTLPEAEVERERQVILREIDMGLDDPDEVLGRALFRTAFRKHPYREPIIGHRGLFQRVSREELLAYYRARYVPNNMVVAVAGAVSSEKCAEVVGERFASVIRRPLSPVWVESEPPQLAPRREDVSGRYNVVRGGVAFRVPHLSHTDSPALDLLAHALGGGESSLFWERLRDRRNLVHHIDCCNWNPGDAGLLWIRYLCDPGKTSEVESAVGSVLEEVATNGLPKKVLEKARRQSLVAEMNGRKTMHGQAARLGLAETVVGDIDYPRLYLERLAAVPVDRLRTVAAHYLVEAARSSVTLGPAPAIAAVSNRPPPATRPPPVEPVSLQSGCRLLLQPDRRSPKVHLCCLMLGGPAYEPAGQRGIASLLARLLTKDTARRTASEVAERIEGLGGAMGADAGNNTFRLSLEVLPPDVDAGIELLADALLRPAFAADTFRTEADAQIAGLEERDDAILEYGFRKLRERFFGPHPFALDSEGRVEDLKNLRPADLKVHYGRIVRPENIVFSACGDFDPVALRERIEVAIAAKLPALPFLKSHTPFGDGPPEAAEYFEPMDREQAVILQAFPDVGITHDDFVVGEMLDELFSGMSSRLFERVREDKGLAYYVGATRVSGLDGGCFALYAGTNPGGQIDEVVAEMDAELARVAAGGVLEDELARCRVRLKAARVMGRQTIGARAMAAALDLTYGLPILDDADYGAGLEACDVARLAGFARRFLIPERRVRLVVGPRKS